MCKELKKLINDGIEKNLFSALSFCLLNTVTGQYTVENFGYTRPGIYGEAIGNTTYYDLASLTKPLVTVLSVMALVQKGDLQLSTTVAEVFNKRVIKQKNITIADLLSHRAGFIDHKKYYNLFNDNFKEQVLDDILEQDLLYSTGSSVQYSDIGYMLLGYIIEEISGMDLKEFWFETIAKPLNIDRLFAFSGDTIFSDKNCACTTNLVHKNRLHCGSVHDDNSRVMGGTAGHAGLFGTIEGMMKISERLLNCYNGREALPFCGSEVFHSFMIKNKNSTWTYGFDTPAKIGSTAGKYFSEQTVGHLGFTGTSFWLDFKRDIAIILITNRAYFSENLVQMKKFRRAFHNAIFEQNGLI